MTREDKPTLAVGPHARLVWVRTGKLEGQVQAQLNSGTPGRLFTLLTALERGREANVEWVAEGKLEGVRRMPRADVESLDKPADIFIVEAPPE